MFSQRAVITRCHARKHPRFASPSQVLLPGELSRLDLYSTVFRLQSSASKKGFGNVVLQRPAPIKDVDPREARSTALSRTCHPIPRIICLGQPCLLHRNLFLESKNEAKFGVEHGFRSGLRETRRSYRCKDMYLTF